MTLPARLCVPRSLLLAAALAAPWPCAALEVEAGHQQERLSGGRADWRSTYLEAEHRFAPRQSAYGWARRTERFDLGDTEIGAGTYQPLGERWTAQLEASASPGHRVLPESSLLGQLSWQAGGGWVASGGWRHSEYTRASADLLVGGIERYWSRYRAGYTVYNGRPENAGSATAHRLAFDLYYGERSRIGIAFVAGREVENIPPAGVTTSQVRAVALAGRHWLSPAWAATWELSTHDQGSLYRRSGLRLGLRHAF